jgi:hypothetical protein
LTTLNKHYIIINIKHKQKTKRKRENKMNEYKTMLLNENKNALKFLHHAHGFNFEKDLFIGSFSGRFTFKMVNDYIVQARKITQDGYEETIKEILESEIKSSELIQNEL